MLSFHVTCHRYFSFICLFISLQFTCIYEIFCQADDIQNEANELLRIRDYLFKELAGKTGQPVEKVSLLITKIYSVFGCLFDTCKT